MNLKDRRTELEKKGEYYQTMDSWEVEIWYDKDGTKWEVPFEIVRDFKNATPIE